MSLWTFLFSTNDNSSVDFSNTTSSTTINPASGLPMIDGIGSIDVAGNAFGTDSSSHFSSAGSDMHLGCSFDSFSSSISNCDIGSSIDSGHTFIGGHPWA